MAGDINNAEMLSAGKIQVSESELNGYTAELFLL
jgi:hypothetical protein